MGGFGSGPPPSQRGVVEAARCLDINKLRRHGCLVPGWQGVWCWRRDGEKVASIVLRARPDAIHLAYCVSVNGAPEETVIETVRLSIMNCPLGGTRPFFICPGAGCGRRVAKLRGYGREVLCRHCYDLSYSSQREREIARAVRRADKVRRRLGDDESVEALPPRPKGMHARTYERLCARITSAEQCLNDDFVGRLERLISADAARLAVSAQLRP